MEMRRENVLANDNSRRERERENSIFELGLKSRIRADSAWVNVSSRDV